jgi:hypothetical protein
MGYTLNEMHQELGEFLTELGHVEFKMILLADLTSKAPIEYLFDECSGLPFGPKISWFKKRCDLSGMSDEKKLLFSKVCKALDDLLPKRNFLVHGETRDGMFKGKVKQFYRVGLVKKNLEYLDEFDRGEHSKNVFTANQVRAVTQSCRDICADLDILRDV